MSIYLSIFSHLRAAQSRHNSFVGGTELSMEPAGSTEHRLLQTILRNYDTDARGVDTNDTVTVSIQLLLLRIQGLVGFTMMGSCLYITK